MIDMALEKDLKMFFRQPLANELNEPVIEMIRHPEQFVPSLILVLMCLKLWIVPCKHIY